MILNFTAIQLKCGDGAHSLEVVENTKDFTLTCDGYDHGSTVYWQRKNNGFAQLATIGSCNSTTCTIAPGFPADRVSLTYLSSNSSRLTSTYTARKDDGVTYYCHNQMCNVHIVCECKLLNYIFVFSVYIIKEIKYLISQIVFLFKKILIQYMSYSDNVLQA